MQSTTSENRRALTVKLFKLWGTKHLGLPYFSADYIRHRIERPETEAGELEEYKLTSQEESDGLRTALYVASLASVCCALAVVVVQIHELDFKDASRNLVPLKQNFNQSSASGPWHRFSCLATDCTASWNNETGSQLASDLLELPLFSMCHPTLSFFQLSTQLFGPPRLLLISIFACLILFCGFLVPLSQVSSKAPNLLLMFLVAPKVTRRVVYDRALELYDDLRKSQENHEHNHKLKRLIKRHGSIIQRHHNPRSECTTTCEQHSSLEVPSCRQSSRRVALSFEGRQQQEEAGSVRDFVDDCISIMRSNWWHQRALQGFYLHINCTIIDLTTWLTLFFVLVYLQLEECQARLTRVGRQAISNNCTIWIENSSGVYDRETNLAAYQRLDLINYELQYHKLGALLLVIQIVWSFTPCGFLLVSYMFVAAELFAWLYELKLQLRLANEYVRQLIDDCVKRSYNNNNNHDIVRSNFQLNRLRLLYASLTRLRFHILVEHHRFGRLKGSRMRTTNSRFESSVAIERFVAQSIEQQQLQLGAALELLEKLHVSFRLFVEHVHHYGPTMTVFICIITAYTYCTAAIIIGYIRRIDDHDPLPFVLMVLSWTFVSLLYWSVSSFHAKAKELQPLIWSLLASMSFELRFRHLHSLWLKQVTALDRDGGLTLRAFNLTITYVKIIQLVIGSATLITLALR